MRATKIAATARRAGRSHARHAPNEFVFAGVDLAMTSAPAGGSVASSLASSFAALFWAGSQARLHCGPAAEISGMASIEQKVVTATR